MSEIGTVVEIKGNTAMVEMQPNSGCKSCGICMRRDKKLLLEVEALPGIEPGQRVLIEGEQKAWAASFLLFVVPIVALIIGVIVGQYVEIGLPHDVASAILGVVFFAASFAIALVWERRIRKHDKLNRPRIVLPLDEGQDSCPKE